jgi:hypothetical protein
MHHLTRQFFFELFSGSNVFLKYKFVVFSFGKIEPLFVQMCLRNILLHEYIFFILFFNVQLNVIKGKRNTGVKCT